MKTKTLECDMLDCFGIWGEVRLIKRDFKFKDYYDKDNKDIQIWKGKNKELFILKDIKEVLK